MLKYVSNTRNVSASGRIHPKGYANSPAFKSSNGTSNLSDDFNGTVTGKAAVAGSPVAASASASQTSQLSATALSLSGKLDVKSTIDPQGFGTAVALAASNFEVTFKLDVATNFTLTGTLTRYSHDHTTEKANFSITANGVVVATLNDLNGAPKVLPLPVGKIIVIFDTQIGAQTDPLGDSGTYTYNFTLVSS